MVKHLWGQLFVAKGYLPQALFEQNVQLITKLRRNMQNRLIPLLDKLFQRKRAVMESIVDQLKHISQIEHTRHRSIWTFLGNLIAGLITDF